MRDAMTRLQWGNGTTAVWQTRSDTLLRPRKANRFASSCRANEWATPCTENDLPFRKGLTRLLPELDIYGRDIRYVEKKAECLDHYRYTIAIENHIGPNHWTEKLSDSFLGYCLPFYSGCPNAVDYFPEESFIPIDIENPRAAAYTIREAMDRGEYERRLPAIVEARRRVVEEYNLANVVGDMVAKATGEKHATLAAARSRTPCIYSRRRVIFRGPTVLLRYVFRKFRAKRWMLA